MDTTYNWSRLEPLIKNTDGLEQVVVSLVAGMTASNGVHSSYMDTMITLPLDKDNFIPFEDLTQEWAVAIAEVWAEDNDVRGSLDKQLEAAAARPTSKPFSWQVQAVDPEPSE